MTPIVDCVLNRTPDTFTAYFDYDNPLSFRSIALGSRNDVVSTDPLADFVQPNEFRAARQNAFMADFPSAGSISWSLEGLTVKADRNSPQCSGRELSTVAFAPQTALFGAESVTLGDHVLVRSSSEFASVLSGGEVSVGGDTAVGHVFAGARAVLAAHAEVRGTLVTAQAVEALGNASVKGQEREHAVVPSHSIAWWVNFGSAHSGTTLAPNETRTLAPGAYGDVVVPSGAVLTLKPGRYQFASLSVASAGALSAAGGDVIVHVASSLQHHGQTRIASDASLMLGYLGTDSAAIDGSFRGTVVAPNAAVVLGAVRNSVYTGAFFARALEVRPSSIVEYAAQR